MRNTDFFTGNIQNCVSELVKVRKIRNFVTAGKLLCVAFFIWGIYKLFFPPVDFVVYAVLCVSVILFIALSVKDTGIVDQINQLKILIKINRTEKEYIEGDFTNLDTGEEFMDPSHEYSLDLDIFGENSLFQAINRTVTLKSRKLLAGWLTKPLKDASLIVSRQNSVRELADDSYWMYKFRCRGAYAEISESESFYIQKWLEEPDFFKKTWIIRIIYIVNAISLMILLAALLDYINPYVPVYLFTAQLFIVLFTIKKINSKSQDLNKVSATIDKYYELIDVIEQKEFQSDRLADVRDMLMNGERNAGFAFKELYKILNGFDQRNNILIWLLLNALFMRDFHLVNLVDKWKSKYGDNIIGWMDAVEEIDALVSMGNFSVNHPEYIFPQIDKGTVADIRNTAHPLLRSTVKVSNDFRLKSMHEIYILTGANMAGKSTFLRTIGVNLVLAMSGNVVCAESFAFRPLDIFTSMRTTDNLSKGNSYFHAELLRLKELKTIAEKSD